MKGIIYCFKSPKGKYYVGMTINPKERYKEHSRHSKYLDTLFYRAVRKYGFENFEYETLHELENNNKDVLWKNLVKLEKEYIKRFRSNNPEYGYNCSIGGDGVVGYKFTQEQKDKISRALKGKMVKEKNPMFGKVGTFKGKKHTEETKELLRIKHTGKKLSEEHKNKLSIAGTGRKHKESSKKKMSNVQTAIRGKGVYCVEKDKEFSSISEAVRKLNVDKGSIRDVCNGKRLSAKGLTFNWIDEKTKPKRENKALKKIKCVQTGKVYESIKSCCDELELRHQHVSAVLNGRQKTTKGLSFEFEI